MVLAITATLFKQTVIPIVNCYKCFSCGSGKKYQSHVRKFRTDSFKNFQEDAQKIWSGQRFCKPNNYARKRPISCISNSFIPVRFHLEPSMHRPAYPDYSKTRLHSIPIAKSLENPVTYESPWTPFLAGCRWYSTNSGNSSTNGDLALTRLLTDKISPEWFNENGKIKES